MSTALTVADPNQQQVQITADQTDLIKKTICQGATDQEMRLFFYDCQRRGVHPLDKLIHFTKRSGKYTPITSIDFMRQRAHGSGAYAGEEPAEFELNMEDGLPDVCTYSVYRIVQGQRCKWTATARWSEYYPGDQQGFMWKKMPFLMLAKCAEALALRKAFPEQLQGLYVREEMDQAARGTELSDPPRLAAEGSNGPSAAMEGGAVNDLHGSSAPMTHQDYVSKVRLSETVRECSQVLNDALADPDLAPPDLRDIQEKGKKRMGELSKK